jgi:hypothetical protein
MLPGGTILRWATPVLGGGLVLVLWGAHSLMYGDWSSDEVAASKGVGSSHLSGASSGTALVPP